MKIKELRTLSKTELIRRLGEKREEVRALRFRVHGEGLKKVRTLRAARIEVAQILTILQAK